MDTLIEHTYHLPPFSFPNFIRHSDARFYQLIKLVGNRYPIMADILASLASSIIENRDGSIPFDQQLCQALLTSTVSFYFYHPRALEFSIASTILVTNALRTYQVFSFLKEVFCLPRSILLSAFPRYQLLYSSFFE